jgi:hypothetical protein
MDLMGLAEIARLAGVSPQAISNWQKRKEDFPAPLAHLASGAVWDGAVVRVWLDKKGLLPGKGARVAPGKAFKRGAVYSLDDIASVVGGERQSYLPQKKGTIVCGRFTRDMNPEAPYEVVVGDLPRVAAKARLVVEQGGSIPVFVKEAPNEWRFHGFMAPVRFVTDRRTVEARAKAAGREGPVAGVLVLEDA